MEGGREKAERERRADGGAQSHSAGSGAGCYLMTVGCYLMRHGAAALAAVHPADRGSRRAGSGVHRECVFVSSASVGKTVEAVRMSGQPGDPRLSSGSSLALQVVPVRDSERVWCSVVSLFSVSLLRAQHHMSVVSLCCSQSLFSAKSPGFVLVHKVNV